ncbi:MAG: DNA repair protein RecN [Lachnospiraceae bacterium]|nr:DNA repair protein RecN [Lachnospiraceae bacterium]
MLQNLHVKNLALIDEIEIDFQPGLNILTGETGAGKSIILGSINLALGGRYSADMLRTGTEYGLVELVFELHSSLQIDQLKGLDIIPENGIVVLSRKLMDGRSISRINGETVNMKTLKDVAGILIDIHGQHEHQSLLSKKNHLAILDLYAKDEADIARVKVHEAFQTFYKCKETLEKAKLDEESRKREADFITFETQEIRAADLVVNEDEELEIQYKRMYNGKKIAEAVMDVYQYSGESSRDNASDLLSRGMHVLQNVIDYDEMAQNFYNQLIEIDSLLNDFNRELSKYGKDLEYSEEEFKVVEERINILNHLKAKYGKTIPEILIYCEEKEEKLLQLNDYDNYIKKLEQQYEKAEQMLSEYSKKLTKIRQKYAVKLTEDIKKGLLDLNFNEVQFEMQFQLLSHYTSNGKDEAEFMVSMNPGEPIKPLGNVASGGELSRIMLAIKTVLADKDEIETLIFDEIDVGISGRTAGKVSEKMAVIGRTHQVICITHLAQIAAMADVHYAIKKQVTKGKTITRIELLNEKESIEELTRILGGTKITDAMIQSAIEMKELARSTR